MRYFLLSYAEMKLLEFALIASEREMFAKYKDDDRALLLYAKLLKRMREANVQQ